MMDFGKFSKPPQANWAVGEKFQKPPKRIAPQAKNFKNPPCRIQKKKLKIPKPPHEYVFGEVPKGGGWSYLRGSVISAAGEKN